MADITVPKDDYGFYLSFTVQDSDGNAYDLTDYTITLKVWPKNYPDTLIVEGVCEPVVAANGTCRYLVTNGDFDTAGNYEAELELTKTGVIESTKIFSILVRESG